MRNCEMRSPFTGLVPGDHSGLPPCVRPGTAGQCGLGKRQSVVAPRPGAFRCDRGSAKRAGVRLRGEDKLVALSKVVRLTQGGSKPTLHPSASRERKGRRGQWEGREASDRKRSLLPGWASAPWARMDAGLANAIATG